MDPAKTLELKAPEEMSRRLENLIEKGKKTGLSAAEKDKLDHFIVLEQVIRLAKVRVRLATA